MEKDTFIIWMAGFYEGEGYVSNDISNNNRLRLGIDQNDATPLHKAKEIWGGNINSRTRVTPTGKICKGNTWRLSHHESLKFIEDIRPFLQIPYKINQIEKAIENSKIRLNIKFKCNYCDKLYASPSGRRRHEKNVHIYSNASES